MTKLKIVINIKHLTLPVGTVGTILFLWGIPFELDQKPIPPQPEPIPQRTNCPQGEPRGLIGVCNSNEKRETPNTATIATLSEFHK